MSLGDVVDVKPLTRAPGKLANVYHLMASPSGGQSGAPKHKQRVHVRPAWSPLSRSLGELARLKALGGLR